VSISRRVSYGSCKGAHVEVDLFPNEPVGRDGFAMVVVKGTEVVTPLITVAEEEVSVTGASSLLA